MKKKSRPNDVHKDIFIYSNKKTINLCCGYYYYYCETQEMLHIRFASANAQNILRRPNTWIFRVDLNRKW